MTPHWLQTSMGYTATWAGYDHRLHRRLRRADGAGGGDPDGQERWIPAGMVFIGLSWIAFVMLLRTYVTNRRHATGRSRSCSILMGLGLPLFFVPPDRFVAGQRRGKRDRFGGGAAELPAHHVRRRHAISHGHHDVGRQDRRNPMPNWRAWPTKAARRVRQLTGVRLQPGARRSASSTTWCKARA